MPVEVSEHVVLEHLLVAVQGELLAAHGADLPVALHVFLELALVVVGWEDNLAERTAFHIHAVGGGGEGEENKKTAEEAGRKRALALMEVEQQTGAPANEERVFDAGWVACSSTTVTQRAAMLQKPSEARVWQTLKLSGRRFVTWSQSRRGFVHHSQMSCVFLFLAAVRWC